MHYHPFDQLMELDESDIRLDCAALHLCVDEYPNRVLHPQLNYLDHVADSVAQLRPGLDAIQRYQALCEVIVEQEGFTGNEDDYYDPQNSYLNRVLERRTGIPISLGIIWIEVARRLKWPVSGINMPGHFLLRIDDPDRFVLIDPFRGGRAVGVDDCKRILAHHFDGKVEFRDEFLNPVGARYILTRVLNNLRQIYFSSQDWDRLRLVVRRLAAIQPNEPRVLQYLAAVSYYSGDVRGACAELSAYLDARPDADDSPRIREQLVQLQAVLAALN